MKIYLFICLIISNFAFANDETPHISVDIGQFKVVGVNKIEYNNAISEYWEVEYSPQFIIPEQCIVQSGEFGSNSICEIKLKLPDGSEHKMSFPKGFRRENSRGQNQVSCGGYIAENHVIKGDAILDIEQMGSPNAKMVLFLRYSDKTYQFSLLTKNYQIKKITDK